MKRRLTVGAFQFRGSGDPERNLAALERGMKEASKRGVRLLATQECALCGYPPNEVESPKAINWLGQAKALRELRELAGELHLFVVVGMATRSREGVRNSVRLVTPAGDIRAPYHKRALYGWDSDNFRRGAGAGGVHLVDGIRVGLRICYEVRFPEYFRELFNRRVELAVLSSADVGEVPQKYDVMRAHLVTRASENGMYVLAANSSSGPQLSPTCLIDPDGREVGRAPKNKEALMVGEVRVNSPPFGRRGRVQESERLTGRVRGMSSPGASYVKQQ